MGGGEGMEKPRAAAGDDRRLSGVRRELKPVLKSHGVFEFKGWVEF